MNIISYGCILKLRCSGICYEHVAWIFMVSFSYSIKLLAKTNPLPYVQPGLARTAHGRNTQTKIWLISLVDSHSKLFFVPLDSF